MKSLLTYINEAGGTQFAGLVRKFINDHIVDATSLTGDLIKPVQQSHSTVLNLRRSMFITDDNVFFQAKSTTRLADDRTIAYGDDNVILGAVTYQGEQYLVVKCIDDKYYKLDSIDFFEDKFDENSKFVFFLFKLRGNSRPSDEKFKLFHIRGHASYVDEDHTYDHLFCKPDLCIANYFTDIVTHYGGSEERDLQQQAYMDLAYARTELFTIDWDKLKEKIGVGEEGSWDERVEEKYKAVLKRSAIEREIDAWSDELTDYIKIIAKHKIGVKSVRMKKFYDYIGELKTLLPKYRDILKAKKNGDNSTKLDNDYTSVDSSIRRWFNMFNGALETVAGIRNMQLVINDATGMDDHAKGIDIFRQLIGRPFILSGSIKGVELPDFKMKTKCPHLMDLGQAMELRY